MSEKDTYIQKIETILKETWNPLKITSEKYNGEYKTQAQMLYSLICRKETPELLGQYLIETEDENGWLTHKSVSRVKKVHKRLKRLFPRHIPLITDKTKFYNNLILVIGSVWTFYWLYFTVQSMIIESDEVEQMSFNEWGDFVSGVASAVTFVWVVLGFFVQSLATRSNTKALKAQLREFKDLAEQIEKRK